MAQPSSFINRKTWGAGTARRFWTEIKFHHTCSVLICDTGLIVSDVWSWSDFLVCAQPNRIQHQLIYNRSIFIKFCTKYFPPTYTEWLISTGWHQIIMLMTWISCQIDVTSNVCQFFFYRSRNSSWSNLKALLSLWWYMILSITFLNRWGFPFLDNDSTWILS